MGKNHPLAKLLRELRADKEMTLRDVERATKGFVSNAYLWQLEQGQRLEPGPRYLAALARVYEVPVQMLFEKAGYADPPPPSKVDIAFKLVLADPTFHFGTRFKGELDQDSKRVIVELYEKATNTTLLMDEEKGRKESPKKPSPRRR